MERIYTFFPSVITIACIAGATHLYLKWIVKYYGDNFKSVAWLQQNQTRVIWTVGRPLAIVYGPMVEELIFRAPLIIAFSALSATAWYGIYASSAVFALIHWRGKKIFVDAVINAREEGTQQSDDVLKEVDRLSEENKRRVLISKISQVLFTFVLGVLAAYYGIKYQSIWIAVGIHAVWNLFVPLVIALIVIPLQIIIAIVIVAYMSIADEIRWRRRRRRRT